MKFDLIIDSRPSEVVIALLGSAVVVAGEEKLTLALPGFQELVTIAACHSTFEL